MQLLSALGPLQLQELVQVLLCTAVWLAVTTSRVVQRQGYTCLPELPKNECKCC